MHSVVLQFTHTWVWIFYNNSWTQESYKPQSLSTAVASYELLQSSWGLFLSLPWTWCVPCISFMNKGIHTLKALISIQLPAAFQKHPLIFECVPVESLRKWYYHLDRLYINSDAYPPVKTPSAAGKLCMHLWDQMAYKCTCKILMA